MNYNRRQVISTIGLLGISFPNHTGSYGAKNPLNKTYDSLISMKADIALSPDTIVSTVGYFFAGDGGSGQYIVELKSDKITPDDGSVILLNNGLYAVLISDMFVNYKMFGAIGDGKNDDGVQIKAAHIYANKKKLPVVNPTGNYWIKQTKEIPIQESVTWGNTVFHLDESFNTKNEYRFKIMGRSQPITINFEQEEKDAFLFKIKPGTGIIPELAPFKNCLLFIRDDNDRIGFRAGLRAHTQKPYSSSWPREEFFYVEEHGRIIGDIAWQFKDYTSLLAYPIETDYLIINGGTFYLSGDNPGAIYDGYWRNGMSIQRSRTIIKNQWVGLEGNNTDTSLTPRTGFYSFSHVYDVRLENVRLLPWEIFRDGKRVVAAGTYGISMNRSLNATFYNVTAEGSSSHWGVFGTNLNKNFRIDHCKLNRVDVHFHCWNLYITNSQIGYNGISVTGGGDLVIENTGCSSNKFVNFRRDYGSRWDGHIRIRHCKQFLQNDSEASILGFNPDLEFDFHYPLSYGRTIQIEDVIIDASVVPDSQATCWLMMMPNSPESIQSVYFPYDCVFKDIWVEGRTKGVRLVKIPELTKLNRYNNEELYSEITPNVKLKFTNIVLEKMSESLVKSGKHNHLEISSGNLEQIPKIFPEIIIENCAYFVGDLGEQKTNVYFIRSTLSKLTTGTKGMKGCIDFLYCHFIPIGYDKSNPAFQLDSEQGTSFTQCTLHVPITDEPLNITHIEHLGFIKINEFLKFNHLHTRLGRDIMNILTEEKVKLNTNFVNMLNAYSDLM